MRPNSCNSLYCYTVIKIQIPLFLNSSTPPPNKMSEQDRGNKTPSKLLLHPAGAAAMHPFPSAAAVVLQLLSCMLTLVPAHTLHACRRSCQGADRSGERDLLAATNSAANRMLPIMAKTTTFTDQTPHPSLHPNACSIARYVQQCWHGRACLECIEEAKHELAHACHGGDQADNLLLCAMDVLAGRTSLASPMTNAQV
jgi:hypothetical protein